MTEDRPNRLLVAAPLLIAAICVPLALGLVGPNPFYGIRTAATRLSEAEWYRINQVSGIVGVGAGILGYGANRLIARSRLEILSRYWACLAVLLAVAGVIVATSLAI